MRFTSVGHRDKAERPILNGLTALRASWLQISAKDGPDVVIGAFGQTFLLEIKSRIENTRKDGRTRTSKGKLSEGQQAFHDAWKGGQILTAFTPEEVLSSVGFSAEDIERARRWTKDWTLRLKPEQLDVLERASAGYVPPRGAGVDAAAQADATFAPEQLAPLKCERPGCGHGWLEHTDAGEMPCAHHRGCSCHCYIGMGPASLTAGRSRSAGKAPRR